jgi:hypothetical protein
MKNVHVGLDLSVSANWKERFSATFYTVAFRKIGINSNICKSKTLTPAHRKME